MKIAFNIHLVNEEIEKIMNGSCKKKKKNKKVEKEQTLVLSNQKMATSNEHEYDRMREMDAIEKFLFEISSE